MPRSSSLTLCSLSGSPPCEGAGAFLRLGMGVGCGGRDKLILPLLAAGVGTTLLEPGLIRPLPEHVLKAVPALGS